MRNIQTVFHLRPMKTINGVNLRLIKAKILKSSILLFLILVVVLWACDPCTDCGPVEREPNVQVGFINQTALLLNQDSLKVVDTLIIAANSLDDINERIKAGEQDLEDNKSKFEEFIDGLTQLRTTSDNLSDTLSSIKTLLTAQISDQEKGNILIDYLLNVNASLDLIFEDSMANYTLALNYDSDITEYLISINQNKYTLELTYDLFDEIDLDHQVLRRAQNIEVKSHSFDSLTVSCDSANFDCDTSLVLDKETVITCYF